MIHFADSSALIKAYVGETGSPEMLAMVLSSDIGVSALTFAEVQATFARRQREGLCTAGERKALGDALGEDWQTFVHVQLDESTLAEVVPLCDRHPLRASDAVQLASAVVLRNSGVNVTFVCSDGRLKDAASGEGFSVVDPTTVAERTS